MIRQIIAALIRDCRSRDHRFQCEIFAQFCDAQGITEIENITPDNLRQYLIHLKEAGHNEGGVHAKYWAMKTLMLSYEKEFEPEGWKNPVHKIRPPKVPEVQVKPVIVMIPLQDAGIMPSYCSFSIQE